ncbi:sphingolipid homeostasis protein orm1 [Oleoguttula sp. CCFEE 5521]
MIPLTLRSSRPDSCKQAFAPTSSSIPARDFSNTGKLSSTVLQRGGLTFAEGVNMDRSGPLCVKSAEIKMSANDMERRRRRRSSSLMYQEPPESLEHQSDQKINPNLNAQWVNAKGAWVIHIVLILLLKIIYDIVPSMSQETSWTLTNISYMFGSYLMFHWVRGVPFEFNAGAYDNLNMWEQIDNGDQYTPAKKFLLAVPICLFLVSTHYTHYDLTYFMINFLATLAVVVPKLPALHRMRFGFFNYEPADYR